MFRTEIDILTNNMTGIYCETHNLFIPLDPANSDYQKMLDDINEQGASCWNGDIPADIQTEADTKLFNKQAQDYKEAKARLTQYILSEGQEEIRGTQETGKQVFNETSLQMEAETEEIILQKSIDPVAATVIRYDTSVEPAVEETIENPLITKDNAERAAAQAIIDSTPQAVKDSF